MAAASAVLVAAAWLVGGFWASVQVRAPLAPYPSPLSAQPWVRSPEPGVRAFFDFSFPLVTLPQTATLWVQGDQAVTPYVNGFRVGDAPVLPPPPGSIIPVQPATLDVLPALVAGGDTIGLDVVNLAGGAPEFRARLELRFGNRTEVLAAAPADWLSTTNVALTGQQFPETGTFSVPTASTADWARATAGPAGAPNFSVTSPADAFTTPPSAVAISGPSTTGLFTASTVVRVGADHGEAWLRAAASGPFTVSLDGQVVAQGPGGQTAVGVPVKSAQPINGLKRPWALAVFDISGWVPSGRVRVTLSVAAGTSMPTVAYLDGAVWTGRSDTTFGTGPGWVPAPGGKVAVLGSPALAFGGRFKMAPAQVTLPAQPYLALRLEDASWVLLGLAATIAAALALGAASRGALAGAALGALPATALVLLLDQTRHLVTTNAPFPATPAALHAVVALLLAGLVLGCGAGVAARRGGTAKAHARPHRGMPGPGAQPAAGPSSERSAPRARPPRRLGRLLGGQGHQIAIGAIAAVMAAILSYQINWDYPWQDELDSIIAAQGIRRHILPIWPSGFEYWKSELYSASIAVIGALSHGGMTTYRLFSVALFAATVLLFGLGLAPMVLPGRRPLQVATTLVFAVAPIEGQFARDVRMYQLVQFLVVLVALLLARALAQPTTGRVAAAMGAVVCMYLAHEVSFGVLPVVPLALCGRYGWSWARNWRWWLFGGLAGGAVVAQLTLALMTHPPAFGIDPSGGPLVAWSPNPFYFVDNVFFTPGTAGGITVVSWLAVLGTVTGLYRHDWARVYLAAFWMVPTATLSLVLPTKDPRYVFVCLPFVFVLAGCAAGDILGWSRAALGHLGLSGRGQGTRACLTVAASALASAALIVSLFNGLTDFGPVAVRLFGADLSHHQYDYERADSYVRSHLRPGDAVIAAAPGNLVAEGIGRPPTYWMAYYQQEVLLYVFEKQARPVDTQYGVPVILDNQQFVRAVNAHPRVWLVISDHHATLGLTPDERATLAARFKLVEDGEDTCVFLATNYPASAALPRAEG